MGLQHNPKGNQEISGVAGEGDAAGLRDTGRIQLSHPDGTFTFDCDAVAVTKDREQALIYLSVAGASSALKALRATLNQPGAFSLKMMEYKDNVGPYTKINKCPSGYKSFSVPLGLGTWHMVLISKRDGVLPCISEEAVWQEIASTRHTTPLMRAWSKVIYDRIRAGRYLLATTNGFGCDCGIMRVDPASLDAIVTNIVKTKAVSLLEAAA